MEKTRVLHVAQAAGGVERYLEMFFKYMDSEKFENILVCSQDYSIDRFEGKVKEIIQIKMEREIGIHDIKAMNILRKIIKDSKPDLVYAHSSKAGALARIANIGLKNKCIYNPHGWAFNMKCSSKKIAMYAYIEKVLALFCDKIICISKDEETSALKKRICKSKKLQIIYNGIDFEQCDNIKDYSITKNDLNIPYDSYIIGMVGRISPQKSPDMFMQVAKIVKESISNAFFIIVGKGEMENEILEYAKKNGLEDSLYITGWVENPFEYIKMFDVACLFSKWEGFGLVLPEYMLMKKPIVATNVDAIPNIIQNKENGLLIEYGDIAEASKAIINIYQDANLRDKLIEGALKNVQKFDVKRVSQEHEHLFLSMLK